MEPETMNDDDAPLFELIPQNEMSPEQRAFRRNPDIDVPLYRLLREPTHLNEFDLEQNCDIAIWRENHTIIYLSYSPLHDYNEENPFLERTVSFAILGRASFIYLYGSIHGKSDAAIAETITFFWSLKQWEGKNSCLEIGNIFHQYEEGNIFDFSALQPKQLSQILDANPTRHYDIKLGTWSAEQSVILATRPYPLHLTLARVYVEREDCFCFSDGGKAFLGALEKRHSCLGKFTFCLWTKGRNVIPVSHTNLTRLFKLTDVFEQITVESADEKSVLLPFTAQVNALKYQFYAEYLQQADLESLDIATKDLDLWVYLDNLDEWDSVLVKLMNRLAKSGHFERLCFAFGFRENQLNWRFDDFDKMDRVAKALIRVIRSNPQLSHFDLSSSLCKVDWNPHVKNMFEAMENHEGLRTFAIKNYPPEDPDFSWIKNLLSRNRRIRVEYYNPIVPKFEKLYALNDFYCKSEGLKKECCSVRPSLVAMAMMGNMSETFQRRALLLSHHADILCELIEDESSKTTALLSATGAPAECVRPKRKARVQPSRAAKKGIQ